MISEFYYGTSWRWPMPYLPRIMLSASYLDARKTIIDVQGKPYMVDSGVGVLFSQRSKKVEKRIAIDRYGALIVRQNPSVAWTLDYPCEPSIRRNFRYTSLEAQIRTNENTIYLRDELGLKNVMSVVQGWTIDEYLSNLDLIKEQGIVTERIGIGSICRRGQVKDIIKVIKYVQKGFPTWVKLHGFGIKITILQTEARFYLYSADPHSWAIKAFGKYENNGRGQKGRTIPEKLPYLLEYVNRIEALINEPTPITIEEALEQVIE